MAERSKAPESGFKPRDISGLSGRGFESLCRQIFSVMFLVFYSLLGAVGNSTRMAELADLTGFCIITCRFAFSKMLYACVYSIRPVLWTQHSFSTLGILICILSKILEHIHKLDCINFVFHKFLYFYECYTARNCLISFRSQKSCSQFLWTRAASPSTDHNMS
jgi:hypothetical protein